MSRAAALALLVAACGSNPFIDYQGICRAAGGTCTLSPACRGTRAPEQCNPNLTPGGSVCCKPVSDAGH